MLKATAMAILLASTVGAHAWTYTNNGMNGVVAR